MNILSLFDGLGTGKLILPHSNYFSSEIDKYAHAVAKYNNPDIISIGDVRTIDYGALPQIDLLIGGSPCTDLSVAGKQSGIVASSLHGYLDLKRNDHEFVGQSYLFWEYMNAVQILKPKHIFLENVRMKKEFLEQFNTTVGFEPVRINSNLLSAQNRDRYYWYGELQSNGKYKKIHVDTPEDKGILLKDIVHEFADELLTIERADVKNFNINPSGKGMNGVVRSVTYNSKSSALTTNKGEGQKILIEDLNEYIVPFDKTLRIIEKEVARGKIGYFRKDSQANRVYTIHDKAVTLCGNAGGGAAKMGQYLFGCITPDRVNKRQNGQRFNDGKKFYTLTAQDKHGILVEGYIRKLTPVECERLQTLPDDTTKYGLFDGVVKEISNAQRYKMIGNGWTKNVVEHIIKK